MCSGLSSTQPPQTRGGRIVAALLLAVIVTLFIGVVVRGVFKIPLTSFTWATLGGCALVAFAGSLFLTRASHAKEPTHG